MAEDGVYTLSQMRRLAVMPGGFIATLVDLGILEPREGLRFTHQDLVVLRTAKMLRNDKVPARKIIQALRNVKANLASAHLASVRLRANAGAVEASAGPRRFDALSGQLLLPLDDPEVPGGVHSFAATNEASGWLAQAIQAEASDDEAAEAGYRRALQVDPACCPAYVNLGALLSEMGRHDEALALYDEALAWCEASPLIHFNRAIALEDTQRPDDAVAAYGHCLQLDPALADAHFNLAVLLERLGDAQGALRHFSAFRRFAHA
jgi:tetratricopeptide (TPR) repeat protein